MEEIDGKKENKALSADVTWQADLGNGIYRNPVLFADYSDPDAIRVGDTYYMTASSFNFTPGLPILTSRDLVNWELKNYALKNIPGDAYAHPRHSCGVWAPSIRFHAGRFYIYYGMPDEGIYMVSTADPLGKWDEPVLVLPGKGLIDSCPFWDEDGRAYVIHGYARSRIGFKSFLGIFEMSPDGTKAISEDHLLFDGRKTQVTIEGPKAYKRHGYYYIFAPAGGVKTGWQTVLRSRSIHGPYEERVVMRQGNSPINGPHQGAWVDTPSGEDWFLHFQDRGAFGRIVHLQPMHWEQDDWCVIGRPVNGETYGEPVLFHKKPELPAAPIKTLPASDDFEGRKNGYGDGPEDHADRLSLIWQWLGNHRDDFYSLKARPGFLRLYARNETGREPAVLWNSANVLTQKQVCPNFTFITRLDPTGLKQTGRAGVLVIGGGCAALDVCQVRPDENKMTLRFLVSKTETGTKSGQIREEVLQTWELPLAAITLGIKIDVTSTGETAHFFFEKKTSAPAGAAEDNETAGTVPGIVRVMADQPYELSPHTWVGAKPGLYAVSDSLEPAGYADFAFVEVRPEKENTDPIFQMVQSGDFETTRYMTEYSKTNMNLRDEKGKSFLHYAARSGNLPLVKYLTERVGLDPAQGDHGLLTPFEEAHLYGNKEIEEYFAGRVGAPLRNCFKNPIRTGMYPDPSIVRVGEDYYMVNSSFVYFPSIPVSHSRDLVNWEIIGYAVTDSHWANLGELAGGRGFWAPDISYSNGRFYITASWRLNDDGIRLRRQMIVSAEKPEGPYSEPVFIDEEGIDPSLFHDDDGRHYMLLNRGARILELNDTLTKAISPARLLWYGDKKKAPEGPHLLKKDGWYYLFLAEGGTGIGHRITLARSRSLSEPFEPCPYNPILSQRDPDALIQRCGHGKPVSTPDGRWFIPYLCGRMPDGKHTLLGRETALASLTWTADGWAVIDGGKGPKTLEPMPFAGTVQERSAAKMQTEDVKDGQLSLEWMSPRGRREGDITECADGVRLAGDPFDLDSLDFRNALLRRQTAFSFDAAATMHVNALAEGGETGFVCYYDERTWLKFGLTKKQGKTFCFMEENRGDDRVRTVLKDISAAKRPADDLLEAPVRFCCHGDGICRSFSLVSGKENENEDKNTATCTAAVKDASYLCDEGFNQGKRFTGPTIGVFAIGKGTEVLLKSFLYSPDEDAALCNDCI